MSSLLPERRNPSFTSVPMEEFPCRRRAAAAAAVTDLL
jgi:hypothetical protein